MIPSDREWYRVPGAAQDLIDCLRSTTPVELPSGYYELLRFSNGGEGPLAVQPFYFQLDPAEYMLETIRNGTHEEFFPGFLMFGSNGGGEFVAFDLRGSSPWPVVYIDMVAGPESVELVAPDFDGFVELIGLESPSV